MSKDNQLTLVCSIIACLIGIVIGLQINKSPAPAVEPMPQTTVINGYDYVSPPNSLLSVGGARLVYPVAGVQSIGGQKGCVITEFGMSVWVPAIDVDETTKFVEKKLPGTTGGLPYIVPTK